MSFVNVAVAGAAVVGSVMASNSASKAAKTAANAEIAASEANIAAQERERQRNEAMFAPYVASGERAQARLDALYTGEGAYGGPSSYAGAAANSNAATLEQILMEQNPDMAAYWRSWESGGAKPGGHRDKFGDFAGYVRAERPQAIAQAQTALGEQTQSYAAQNPSTTITRNQVEDEIRQSMPYQLSENEFDAQSRITDSANFDEALRNMWSLDRELGNYSAERGNVEGIEAQGYGRDLASFDAERAASGARNTEQRQDGQTRAGEARTAMRGVGDENYANTVSLLEADYLKRQGFTDAEIAAWEAKALEEQQKAQDAAFSRMGVTGATGRTTRTLGEVAQSYARDRALYEGERNRADYEPLSAGRLGADARRGDVYLGAEASYADDLGRAADTYYGNERTDDARLYGQRNDRSATNTANLVGFAQNYYGQVDDAYQRNTAAERDRVRWSADARGRNQANRTAGQQAAYGDYVGYVQGQANQGYGAASQIASYGQTAINNQAQQTSQAARAASDAAIARGQNQANSYGAIADGAGAIAGIIRNQNQPKAATTAAKKPGYIVRK